MVQEQQLKVHINFLILMFLSLLSRGAISLGGRGALGLTVRPLLFNVVRPWLSSLMALKFDIPVIKIEMPTVPQNTILEISTFKRKKAKVKKSKLRQRRKKMRRLSDAKREKKNY